MSAGPCRYFTLVAAVVPLVFSASASAAFNGILDRSSIGAAQFLEQNPTADGRGVAIAILDTGVDMGIPGLGRSADGTVKVVVARDFTREGRVECRRARKEVQGDKTLWLVDGGSVRDVPASAGDSIFLGFLDEAAFRTSDVPDLNANGRNDDRFGVVVFNAGDGGLKAIVDLDGDGSMAGESVMGTYESSFQTASFRGNDPAVSDSPVTLAINIDQAGGDLVNVDFHMATGAHGTHVAGIAAGNGIAEQEGYDGIAPGATLLSLKIGHNGLAGGATVSKSIRSALEFAAEWGRRHNMPVVVNLSYTVGSEVEGHSDIDAFCERFAIDNPHVVIVSSAGNQGPGLSTVGTPATSNGVLAVAAVFSPEAAAEVMGASGLDRINVFSFSSRGGEVAKPDVAAPGVAGSTVPRWMKGDVMAGTSMASPQVAGAAALILSAMIAKNPGAVWNSGMIFRAFRATARPLAGYTSMDCGAGLVDVPAAWRSLEKALGKAGAAALQFMRINVEVPTLSGASGGAIYWRAGGWVPSRSDPVEVRITPVFSSLADGHARSSWFQRFTVRADAPWVGLSKTAIHVRGDGEATVNTWIDARAVATPGVHVANVRGVSDSGIEFSFPVTVVTPYPDSVENGVRSISLMGLQVRRAGLVRIPFDIPAGTRTVGFQVRTSEGSSARARVVVYDGGGHVVPALSGAVVSTEGRTVEGLVLPADLLSQGTCELAISGSETDDSRLDVKMWFNMLDVPEVGVLTQEPGKQPRSSIEVVNGMEDVFQGSIEGSIDGFEVTRNLFMRGDMVEDGFSAGQEFERVDIELEMSAEDFARFTDVAVNVLDRAGRAVVRTGFSQRRLVVSVPVPRGAGQSDFRLQLRPGMATGNGSDARAVMRMRYIRGDKVALVGTVDGNRLVRLYPGVRSRVDIEAASTPPSLPGDAVWFGVVKFTDRRDGRVRGMSMVRARSR